LIRVAYEEKKEPRERWERARGTEREKVRSELEQERTREGREGESERAEERDSSFSLWREREKREGREREKEKREHSVCDLTRGLTAAAAADPANVNDVVVVSEVTLVFFTCGGHLGFLAGGLLLPPFLLD